MLEQLDSSLRDLLGNTIWQIAGFCLVITTTFIARLLVRYFLDIFLSRLTQRTATQSDDQLLKTARKPIFFLVYLIGFYLALEILNLPQQPLDIPKFIAALFTSLLTADIAWFLYCAVDILDFYLKRLTGKTETKLDDQLVPIIRRSIRALIITFAAIMIIQNLGYSVSSLVAGLGLGGLAFALAAKDSLANMFGSITIFADRPFQIGDWIKTAGAEGVVEDVGFRSTRVRTFEKTLITIPNSKLTSEIIENMDARPIRRVNFVVGLTYGTKAEQIEKAVSVIREILKEHPGVDQDFWLVNFTNFSAYSLDIFVYYFTKSKAWAEHLRVRQEVNLIIMKNIEKLGLEFAFPTQTIHFKRPQPEI